MILDQDDLFDGLKTIVGTWRPEFLVNAFSNDLAQIPASEFKSKDGRDFTALQFEFFEDHTFRAYDGATGKEEKGSWEQTGYGTYKWTPDAFFDLPDSNESASLVPVNISTVPTM